MERVDHMQIDFVQVDLAGRHQFFMYGQGGGGCKLEINIPPQQIRAKRNGGLINEGGIILSEYSNQKL